MSSRYVTTTNAPTYNSRDRPQHRNTTRQPNQNAPRTSGLGATGLIPQRAYAPPTTTVATTNARALRRNRSVRARARAPRYTSPWHGGTNWGTFSSRYVYTCSPGENVYSTRVAKTTTTATWAHTSGVSRDSNHSNSAQLSTPNASCWANVACRSASRTAGIHIRTTAGTGPVWHRRVRTRRTIGVDADGRDRHDGGQTVVTGRSA